MPRRGLRDLGGHPPPRNFQPHQPLNHCPHLQPPHQSQPEPSREPRRGPRDDFSVLGWVLCGHCFAVSRVHVFALGVKRVRDRGAAPFRARGIPSRRVGGWSTRVRAVGERRGVPQRHGTGSSTRKCVPYLPTSSCGSLVHSFRRTAAATTGHRVGTPSRSTETVRLAGSPASFSISSTRRQKLSHFYVHGSPCHGHFSSTLTASGLLRVRTSYETVRLNESASYHRWWTSPVTRDKIHALLAGFLR